MFFTKNSDSDSQYILNIQNIDMSLLLIDSFKSDHVGVTKYVRPKVGPYAPVDTIRLRSILKKLIIVRLIAYTA